MEKRIGAAIILVERKDHIEVLNNFLSVYADIIIARQGVPIREKGISIISLLFEGTNDEINTLTGKLGRLSGVQVKTVFTRYEQNQ